MSQESEKAVQLQNPAPTRAGVDHTALRVNQATIITLLILGFVANQVWLVALVAGVMLLGTAVPQAALFQRLYSNILRPLGWLRPDVHHEAAAPHRFAQGLGGSMLLVALIALLNGLSFVGWLLVLVVVVLAAINLLSGFCVGCFVYFQLQRLRV